MCHPEPYEGTLREYRLCVIPSAAEGSLSEYCQDLNRDPSKACVVLPCLQGVKRARRNRRRMGASLLCHFEGARRFTLLAKGKTSAPQSAAYGRMPMATCCRKRQLFRRRLPSAVSGEIFGILPREPYAVYLETLSASDPRAAGQRPDRLAAVPSRRLAQGDTIATSRHPEPVEGSL